MEHQPQRITGCRSDLACKQSTLTNFHQLDKDKAAVFGKIAIQEVSVGASTGYLFGMGLVFKKLFFVDDYKMIVDNFINLDFYEI